MMKGKQAGRWRWVMLLAGAFLCWGAHCERSVIRNGVRMSAEEARRMDLAGAEEALATGDYDAAVSRYEQFLSDWPRSPETPQALVKLGEACYKKGDQERAREIFRQVIDRWPRRSEAVLAAWGLALEAYQRKDCASVEQWINAYRSLATDPTWDRMTMLLVECRLAGGDESGALFLLGEEVREGKDSEFRDKARSRAEALVVEMSASALENAATQYSQSFPGDIALLALIRRLVDEDRLDEAGKYIAVFEANFRDSPYLPQLGTLKDSISLRTKVKFNRIGVLLPTSGRLAGYGERALKGIMLAGNIFNAANPTLPAEFILRDSADAGQVEALVTELVEQEFVIAIIGPLRTGTALRAAQKAQELRVPLITLSPGENLAEMGDMIYQNCLTKKPQVQALADYAVNGQSLKRIGILSPDDEYGREFTELFRQEIEAQGGKITAGENYPAGATDFKHQITSLKNQAGDEGLEALFLPDSWEKVAMIAPQLRFYQFPAVRLLGINAWHDEKLISKTQPEDIMNAVFTDGFAPELGLPRYNDFSRQYSELFGDTPDLVSAQAYETAELLLHLIEEFRLRDREQLKRALDHVSKYPGVLGSISIDEKGRFLKPIYLFTISDGRFRVIATYD